MTIQRAQHSAGELAWRFGATTLPINSQLLVNADECVVVQSAGAVLGVITSGSHWLHPQPFPFLESSVVGPNVHAEVWFVKTATVPGFKFGGQIGVIVEPVSRIGCNLRVSGDFSMVANNPIAIVVTLLSTGAADATPLVQWAASLLLHETKDIVSMVTEVEQLSFLEPEMVRRLSELLPGRLDSLAQAGLQLGEVGALSLSISDEDQSALTSAAQKETKRSQIVCAQCGAQHDGGRFCVQCGAPLAT